MVFGIKKVGTNSDIDKFIDEAVTLLENGEVIAYPTETVYGLGADAQSEKAIEDIHKLKGRKFQKDFLVLVASELDIIPLVREITPAAKELIKQFWPDPLTLIFEMKTDSPQAVISRSGRLGIRISPDPLCQKLLKKFSKPLISTSANIEGEKPAQSAQEVYDYFGDNIKLILDGGPRKTSVPSTVLDVTVTPPKILRQGSVQKAEIMKFIGDLNG